MKSLTSVIFLTLVSISSYANTSNYHFAFDVPSLVDVGTEKRVIISGLANSIDVGKPSLPLKMIKILLPKGAELEGVKVDRKSLISHGFDHNIYNSKSSVPLSLNGPADERLNFLTNTVEDYPTPSSYMSVQTYFGEKVLVLKLHPVFITKDRELISAGEISVSVEFKGDDKKIEGFTTNEVNKEVLEFVDNRDEFPFLPLEKSEKRSGYDYLILSSKELISYRGANSLHIFKEFLESRRGLKVKIVDVKEAVSSLTGVDNSQKLRNYIRKEYKNSGIKYVLLAGDSDGSRPVIPVRKLYSVVNGYLNGSWKKIARQIPSDFYYSCLDGKYNGDGDDQWGEITDGENGGDVDFLCEVTVGRFSVDNSSELSKVVAKTLKGYELKNRNKSALMVGELLFKELDLWGKDYMNQLVGQTIDHGFITKGYDNSWQIKGLYDKDRKWSSRTLKSLIAEKNFLMVNHLGHSNTSYNMKMSGWSFRGFDNTLPFFFYSQGCYAGNYTSDTSIVEKMLISKGGPFAAVANTVYGLGPEDPAYNSTKTPGTSHILHRFFIDRAMKAKSYLAFGDAHRKSKEDILIYINHQEARWVVWTATLFGDPALRPLK